MNKDTNYFSNIIESISRDVHCYAIQVNDSRYGDTRIVSPSKSEVMNIIRVKGGDNTTYLKTTLDLEKLREHQALAYNLQKDSEIFKPTPPGWRYDEVTKRINYAKGRTPNND